MVENHLLHTYNSDAVPQLQKKFNYKNRHQVPAIKKVTINMGLGEDALDGKKLKTPRSKRSKGKDKYKRKRPPCSGNKQTYKTKREANIAAKAMYNQGRGLRSYRCTDCAGFHLTKLRQGR